MKQWSITELAPAVLLAFSTTVTLSACEASSTPHTVVTQADVAARVDPENIRTHVEFLADDFLEGRYTGTRGYDIAARYVATQYKLLGLEPAGEAGSYYQEVTFRRATPSDGRARLKLAGTQRELDIPADMVFSGSFHEARQSVNAGLVFVGNGVSAPELGYDDYADVDVEGKIAVMMRYGSAPALPESERAHFSSTSMRLQTAVARGAVGVIYLYRPDFRERASWDYIASSVSSGSLSWVDAEGNVPDSYPELKLVARASYDFAEELFVASERDLDAVLKNLGDGKVSSFELPARLEAERVTAWEDFTSPNVAAVLPGSDPALRNEYVLFSGHLDAVGMSHDEEAEDRINNGAYDNATGIGIMLEVARVMAGMEERPARSTLFLAVTGEEQGLLGSEYWAANPTVPIDDVSANVNLDMPVLTFPLASVIGFGAEHSEMEDIVRRQAATQDLALSPDPWPEERIFTRSDQYSFVKAGVPAVFLVAGNQSSDPDIDGEAKMQEFLGTHYHKPSDDLSRNFDMDSAKRFAATNLLIGLEVANRERKVAWLDGDYFGERFGKRFVSDASGNSGEASH